MYYVWDYHGNKHTIKAADVKIKDGCLVFYVEGIETHGFKHWRRFVLASVHDEERNK